MILLETRYSGRTNQIQLLFYDYKTNSTKVVEKSYEPYLIAESLTTAEVDKLKRSNAYKRFEYIYKYNNILNENKKYIKIYGYTPLDIIELRKICQLSYEDNIRIHLNYLYDSKFTIGQNYDDQLNLIEPSLDNKFIKTFLVNKSFPFIKYVNKHLPDLFSEIIPPKMLAIDIEVEDDRIPQINDPKQKIISCSFYTDDYKCVYYLDENMQVIDDNIPFNDERSLIHAIIEKIKEYSIILTFNGNNFDLPYIKTRGNRLDLDTSYIIVKKGWRTNTYESSLLNGFHVDLYKYFSNPSIKNYVYGSKYDRNSLADISKTLLNDTKIEHEGILIKDLPLNKLIEYNQKDTELTYELMVYENFQAWSLIITFCRMTNLPIPELLNHRSQWWIKSVLYWEHRSENILIPRPHEIRKASTPFEKSIIEGKGYKGAYVINPVQGIYFGAITLDFASLYPSIIKEYNLSYETINCKHEKCKKKNKLKGTPYWSCLEKQGMFSYIIGFYRDIRVLYFKKLAKTNLYYGPIEQGLKVFINSAYGVFGSDTFDFFCLPVAESTTGIGRYSIKKVENESKKVGAKVIYGDTDSVLLVDIDNPKIMYLIQYCKDNMDLELEHEKTFQFLALSNRKKNYVGIHKGTKKVEMKGIIGKKKNTPLFIKKAVKNITEIMKLITNIDEFHVYKQKIIDEIRRTRSRMKLLKYKLEDYSVLFTLNKKIIDYKVQPQHVKAMQYSGINLDVGESIAIVKTRKPSAKILQDAKKEDLDIKTYGRLLRSASEQILDALGISWDDIIGQKKMDGYIRK